MTDPIEIPLGLAGELQKSLFERLSIVPGMPAVVTEAPTSSEGDQEVIVYPFVLLGDDQVTDVGTKTRRLERHEVAIHVCMQSTTKIEVRAVQELVRATLDRQPLPSTNAKFSNPRAPHMNTPLLEDGATYVGGQIFTCFAQPL